MTQVYSTAAKATTKVDRIIGKISGSSKGPIVVFFGGIHGNETAGVFALQEVFKTLKENKSKIKGTIYGIAGNLKALELNQRYIQEDLNRIWTRANLERIELKKALNEEEKEQQDLLKILKSILKKHSGNPFYFIDLHTTSSKTLPFITINDALINRKFSKFFPVPIVLGIEEFLDGPLLSYINQLGYVSLGFESGQHDDKNAITNCVSFIYLTLVFTKALRKDSVIGFPIHYNILKTQANKTRHIFEVIYRHKIEKEDSFKMLNGFKSFQKISKGKELAISNSKTIKAKLKGEIFMPLYQNKGEDGFFIIKRIKPIFLKLSTFLRRINFDEILILLPGIRWMNTDKEVMLVNLRTAKFLAKPLFHLLGYRNKQIDKTHIKLYNREKAAKTATYKKEKWHKVM